MTEPSPFSPEDVTKFKNFIEMCKSKPSVLHHPDLSFFKSYVQSMGARVPPQTEKAQPPPASEPESEESDLELDMASVIAEPDTDAPQPMGDPSLEPTEEQIDQSVEKRSEAMSEYRAKNYDKAIQLYTESIQLDPTSPISYAKRAQVYIALKKPNACIRDCERALEINPDSALAHKMRGRANQLLGNWEEAARDLRVAVKSDFDEEANEWLNEITPNIKKIEEHKRKKERRQREREDRERQERVRRAREAQEKARAEAAARAASGGGGCCGGGPCGDEHMDGEDAGGPGMGQFAQFLNDPEVIQAFQDPEVAAAFKDVASNPSNLFKYQSNPKVMSVINKVATKFAGSGGAAGLGGMGGLGGMMGGLGGMMGGLGGMGGMGGMPGMGGGAPKPPKPSEHDDFGLD